MSKLFWKYCTSPSDVESAIREQDNTWSGLKSADQIIDITFDSTLGCYVVFWTVYDKCGQCEFLDTATAYISNPPQYRCKKHHCLRRETDDCID